ncbi:ABC-three component system middle component 5 [Yoonia sp. R2-816]|uniref:ABC-three component system middle component 5 n=1 Tax=Yoonia sp. R2-816 TaxID=3342638 RepID=UPI003726743F
MFSLTYSSAYDPYHAVFRFVALFEHVEEGSAVDFESLRIADFYHSFPWLLRDFSAYAKIPGFLKDKNAIVKKYPQTRFDRLPDKRLVFRRMLASQFAARTALVQSGSWTASEESIEAVTRPAFNSEMMEAIGRYNSENKTLLGFLGSKLISVPLFGPGGLKDRSGLGEFRYDIV